MNEINYKSNQISSMSFAKIKNIVFKLLEMHVFHISSIKNKKATGIDLVPNEILKCDNIIIFYTTCSITVLLIELFQMNSSKQKFHQFLSLIKMIQIL